VNKVEVHSDVHYCPTCGQQQMMFAPPWGGERPTHAQVEEVVRSLGESGVAAVFMCSNYCVWSFCCPERPGHPGITLHVAEPAS
jgi:hypothetical protein